MPRKNNYIFKQQLTLLFAIFSIFISLKMQKIVYYCVDINYFIRMLVNKLKFPKNSNLDFYIQLYLV